MGRRSSQQGATLILVIGVIATLATLASALVLLTGNAARNTARDRSRAKAFNVAEAAVDLALYKVGTNWPLTTDATLSEPEKKAFLDRFPSSEFPNADVSITYFDNYDRNEDGQITRADVWPRDGNGTARPGDQLIYIEAQASVGGKKARIQCQAQRLFFDSKFPRGIAAVTDGNVTSNNPKPSIGSDKQNDGYMAPDQTALSLLAGGTVDSSAADPALFPATNVQQSLGSGVVDSVLDPDVLQVFIRAAVAAGTWYSDIASEQAKGAKPWPDENAITPYEGIVVLEASATKMLELNGNGNYNGTGLEPTPKPPGVLIVIGPHTMYPDDPTKVGYSPGIDLGGNGRFYGVMYTDGSLGGNGTITIAGMVLARGGIDLKGNRRIEYNDSVVVNLTQVIQLSAQTVQNTWRQIQPL